jgi:hypothetical protein
MQISLNKFLQELKSLSPGVFSQIENLYPLEFNLEVSSVSKFSIALNHDTQAFNFFENPNPNFSIKLNTFTMLNALNSKQIPTKSISGDVESALIFLGALANIDIDLELLVYKYFGDIPALILRKVILTQSADKDSLRQENEANKILESFRDLSIRLDRLEHALIN